MGASEQGVSVFYSEVRPSPTVVRGEKDIEHDNVFYRARRVRSRVGLFLGAGRLLPDGVHPATDSFSHRTDMFNVVTTPVPLFFFSAFFAFIDDRCFVHEEFLS